MKSSKAIIIKKIKKQHGGGHHGGAWKVAYADFVTAMMAFFLLLWLLNMSSDEKRIRLSRYFKHFSIYTEGGTSFMGKSSEIFDEAGESADKVFRNPKGRDVANVKNKINQLETGISSELGGAASQVAVESTKEGIRIQIIDKDGDEIFLKGSNSLTPRGETVLKSVGNNIKELSNKISIEGHTDSTPVEKENYTNWELSSERALTARRVLEASGVVSKRVVQVAGFADNSPLEQDNPTDPKNRRISIVLYSLPEKEQKEELMPPKYSVDNPAGNNIELPSLVNRESTPPQPQAVEQEQSTDYEESDAQPVINKDWIPVIDKTDNQPVLDEGWTPVIKDENKKPVNKEEDNVQPVQEEPEKKKEIVIDNKAGIEKLPYIKFYGADQTSQKSTFVPELNSPVLSNDQPR